MKHFKSALALILTVSVIGTALPSLAFEDTAEENTEVFSYPAYDIYDDEITDTSFMAEDIPVEAEEAAIFADSYTEAPGYQTDPDTGESTIDENGYITNTYGYSMHSDPFNSKQVLEGKEYSAGSKHLHDPYWLKDENFFGKWNSDTESWEIKGKLDYDNYAGLSDVEMCVKDGNYEDAKLALYNYYIIVERGRDRKKDISTAKKDKITADLLLKNFMYNANSGISPLELLYINNTPKYHSADITDTVKKYIGTRQNLSFWAIATDKNGDKAIFNSKEAGEETSPYLLVKVNGTERIIYPSDDTNIKAGSNSSKAFGSEETLTACEDAINSPNTLVNENTSRVYMKFDMSWLKTGDTVTAATLNLYGHNENENAEKEVVIFYSDDSDWNEKTSTYKSVLAQVVYSYDQLDSWAWNQPSGAGYRYQEELLRFNTWYDKLVKLYNLTGDEKYAYTALRQLMDFIYIRGNDICWLKSLDVALRTQCMPTLTMQLIESEYMTPDVFTSFMKYMYVEANGAQYFTRDGNWGTSESQGLYTVAATFPEFTDSQKWVNRVKYRYETLSNSMIKSDWVCTELSLGYTDYTIDTLIGSKKIADELGITDYPYTQKTLDNILHLGLFEYYSSMPGIRDNQVGDGYSHRGNFLSRMQYLAKWFDDPHLNYAAGFGGEEPDFTSKLYPVGLKAVMRTGWGDKAWYMFTDADGGFGNHSHPDDNSITVMADGQYLLVDPLYGSYSASDAKTWLTSTIAHNTVTMNGKNQYSNNSNAKKGTMDRWETNNTYDFLTSNTPNTQDASSYKRSTFFLRNKFWLVNDYLIPKNTSSNKYVQSWHFLPEADISMDENTKTTQTNMPGVNIQVIPVTPESYTKSSIKSGYYSEGQGSVSNADYTEYEQNVSGNAVFNTLLLPVSIGDEYDAEAVEIEIDGMNKTDASSYEIYLKNNKTGNTERYIYYLLHNSSKKGNVTIGEFTTDASMLFIETNTNGSPITIAAQDVSFINQGGNTVYKSDNQISEISVTLNSQICTIDGSALTADQLEDNNLQITASGLNIKTIKLNGDNTNFVQSGNSLYLGTAPSPNPEATPTAKPSSAPSHGNGGGGGGGGGSSVIKPATPTPKPAPTAQPEVTPAPAETVQPDITPEPVTEMTATMKDELENHWAKAEIEELYQKGIVSGISDTSLGLEIPITRAQFASLIVRTLDIELVPYEGGFNDVGKNDWYADALQTAYNNNLLSGFDSKMSPDSNITREEMAVILSNAVKSENSQADYSDFSDTENISAWAQQAVDNTVSLGLMFGMDDGSFAPKNDTKRCEAFVVIHRLLNLQN
jgi:hypothetical protein